MELDEEKFSRVLHCVYHLKTMTDYEKMLDEEDAKIPELARIATREAYERALASGSSVLIIQDNELRKVAPDGSYEVIKKFRPGFISKKELSISNGNNSRLKHFVGAQIFQQIVINTSIV